MHWNAVFDKVKASMDFGILLDHIPNIRYNISMMVNKAYGLLGYIKRWSKKFFDPYTTKMLFRSLVRPILKYVSIIWNPSYAVQINSIESVQKQF